MVPEGKPKQGISRREWIKDLLMVLVLGGLCLLFFWPIITPNAADRASFPPGDFDQQFHAFGSFAASELAQGRLPLWNPYTYSGHPFLADVQAAVFYPVSLLTIFFSLALAPGGFSLLALEWQAIFHFFLASVFTYVLMRRLVCYRGAALLAALVFAYGGYLTSYPSQQLAVLEVGVWLPLILLMLDVGMRRLGESRHSGSDKRRMGGFPFLSLAGVAWGISLLAGHPQTSMYVFYTTLAYAIFSAWLYRVRWQCAVGGFLLFEAIGFGLAAVQLIPGLEYMRLSTRATITYEEVSGGFPRQDVLQILLPGSVSVMSPLYVGILPLLLAVLAPLLKRTAQVFFWVCLAVVALLVSFGGNTFVYSLFYLVVPGFGLFRSQERAAYVFGFSAAILAGYGTAFLLEPLTRQRKRRFSGFFRAVGYLSCGGLLLVALAFYGWLTANWATDSPFGPALMRSVLFTVLTLLSLGVFFLRRWGKVRLTTWATLAVLLVVFDLFTVNWRNNVSAVPPDARWQASPLVLAPLQDEERPFRLYNEWQLPGNYGCVYELEEAWGASPLRLKIYDELFRAVPIERVWELLNVRYVNTWRKTVAAPSDVLYDEPNDTGRSYLHRLRRVGPRAYVVYQAEVADDSTALRRLADPAFDPWSQAVVSEPLPFEINDEEAHHEPGRLAFGDRDPGRLAVDVDLPADGLLVLSEVFYPGWEATVDGQPAKIFRAQHALRGLPLRAGEHHVEMVFRPATFSLGAILSAVTLAIVVVLVIAAVVLRKRRVSQEDGTTAMRDNST